MRLNWIVILQLIITNGQLITLSSRNDCSCSQLLDNISCLSAKALCIWSNNSCIAKECLEISIEDCPKTFGCYLDDNTCTEFVECNQLSGNSIIDCFSQNNQCSWKSDSNCVPLNQIPCEEVTEQDSCTYSGVTLCYWRQDQCKSMRKCSDQTIEKDCRENSLTSCKWNSENQTCIDSSCSQQPIDQCSSFLLSSLNINQFQVCHLVSSECVEANPTDLSQEDCYSASKGTYFWDIDEKKCNSCALDKSIVEQIESTCRCSQILSEADCNQKCRWVDTYCKDRWCKDNLTQMECESDRNCFYQDDLCQVYKGCHSLKQDLCESDTYDDQCKWDTECQSEEEPPPIICVNIKTADECNQEIETNSEKYCIWISDTEGCKGAQVSSCSAINDVDENSIEGLCDRFTDQCLYNSEEEACEQLICEDYSDAESCQDHQWTIIDESGNLNLCSWNGTHCISGIDIEQFDQTNCYSEHTRFQLTFDATSQKCTKCPGIGERKDHLPDHLEIQKSVCSTPILSEQEQFEPQIIQPLQFLYISPNLITPLWPPIKEKLLQLTNMNNITPYQLYQQIEDIYLLHFQAKNLKNKINFNNLQEAISNFEFKKDLLQKAIPHFAKLALRLESEFRDYIPMLTDKFTLTHEQCAILIANMFFCTLHLQPDFKHLPSTFICAKLFNHNNEDNSLKIQKLRCFLYYIMYVFENKNNVGNVVFTRQRKEFNLIDVKLCEFIYCENGNMEQVEDAYIVDFANKRIGGGVLTLGCVQEEILFLIHPETLVSVLLTTEIQGDEAILIEGVERIIDYSGYKNTFKCEGLLKKRRQINFICIDAQDYATNRHQQYNDYYSQIVKAYTGFYGRQNICTGRWGCGVFGGEWQLKTLIQWLAASCCECKQLIFVNDQNYIFNQAFQLLGNISTLQLMKYIKEYCELKFNNAIDFKVDAIDYILLSNNN